MGYIRFLLAVSVFQGHVSSFFLPKAYECAGGIVSVRLFYVISGFLIAKVLIEKYSSIKFFYVSRALRLFPVYYLVLFITILTSIIFFFTKGHTFLLAYYAGYYNYLNPIELILLSFPQLILFTLDLYGFIGVNTDGLFLAKQTWINVNGYQFLLVPQAWTLGLEIGFYLIIPFLVRNNKFLVLLLFLSLLIELLIKIYIPYSGDDPWARRFFLSEAQYFLLGSISYQYQSFLYIKKKKVIFFSYVIFFCYLLSMESIGFLHSIGCCITMSLLIPSFISISKYLPLDRFIGNLSYPFYISHWFFIHLLKNVDANFNYPKLTCFFITVIFSIIVNITIERHVDKYRSRIHGH